MMKEGEGESRPSDALDEETGAIGECDRGSGSSNEVDGDGEGKNEDPSRDGDE